MHIVFDKQNVHVQVLCGTLEKYEPSKEIEEIHKRVSALSEKAREFMEKEFNPELEAIDAMVQAENKKAQDNIKKDDTEDKS